MLADTVDIENVDGIHNYSFNADTGGISGGGTFFSPLHDFDVTVDDRAVTPRLKQQQSGAWPTRSYEDRMNIHIEGSLFGDTSENYIIQRKAMMLAFRGVPGAHVTHTKRGRIFVTPQGEFERWYADFGPMTFSAPVDGAHPTGTDILITVVSFIPWFIGEDSGDPYWWS